MCPSRATAGDGVDRPAAASPESWRVSPPLSRFSRAGTGGSVGSLSWLLPLNESSVRMGVKDCHRTRLGSGFLARGRSKGLRRVRFVLLHSLMRPWIPNWGVRSLQAASQEREARTNTSGLFACGVLASVQVDPDLPWNDLDASGAVAPDSERGAGHLHRGEVARHGLRWVDRQAVDRE
jgi:hypothetical protein